MSSIPGDLTRLPTIPAEMMDTEGWDIASRALPAIGKFAVSRDGVPEAVILPVADYIELWNAANVADVQPQRTAPGSFDESETLGKGR